MEIYGTIGPSCHAQKTLEKMFHAGMTGARLNLSHTDLDRAAGQIRAFHQAAERAGVSGRLLIDLQGPELRIGALKEPLVLKEEEERTDLPLPKEVLACLKPGQKLLFDDGKIEAECVSPDAFGKARLKILRGGSLNGSKSVAIEGVSVSGPAVTKKDFVNLKKAQEYGVSDIMQPFVRSGKDLDEVRKAMREAGCPNLRLLAKIENLEGVKHLSEIMEAADEIVIARGDLGNAVPLWKLPGLQRRISLSCLRAKKPFMVVTQMLASMEHRPVPTRAEVNDIYQAVLSGASSVMVTGETAVGDYPVEVIQYLFRTAEEAQKDMLSGHLPCL